MPGESEKCYTLALCPLEKLTASLAHGGPWNLFNIAFLTHVSLQTLLPGTLISAEHGLGEAQVVVGQLQEGWGPTLSNHSLPGDTGVLNITTDDLDGWSTYHRGAQPSGPRGCCPACEDADTAALGCWGPGPGPSGRQQGFMPPAWSAARPARSLGTKCFLGMGLPNQARSLWWGTWGPE